VAPGRRGQQREHEDIEGRGAKHGGGGGGSSKRCGLEDRGRNALGGGVLLAAWASWWPAVTCGRPYNTGEEEGGSPVGKF
jgi:hypothetical protein